METYSLTTTVMAYDLERNFFEEDYVPDEIRIEVHFDYTRPNPELGIPGGFDYNGEWAFYDSAILKNLSINSISGAISDYLDKNWETIFEDRLRDLRSDIEDRKYWR